MYFKSLANECCVMSYVQGYKQVNILTTLTKHIQYHSLSLKKSKKGYSKYVSLNFKDLKEKKLRNKKII